MVLFLAVHLILGVCCQDKWAVRISSACSLACFEERAEGEIGGSVELKAIGGKMIQQSVVNKMSTHSCSNFACSAEAWVIKVFWSARSITQKLQS